MKFTYNYFELNKRETNLKLFKKCLYRKYRGIFIISKKCIQYTY